jgi:sodium/bile acid cotransporter 7
MILLFLPLGLLLAILTALFVPAGGLFISENNGLKILVFIIFLISGYQTGGKGITLDKQLARILLAAALISLILSPLLGLLVSRLFKFPPPLAMGLIIICAVPPTLSSGIVITEVSRGNAVLALLLTVSLNLLGIFILPYTLDVCLKAAGPVDIDQTALLIKMLFFVLLPFAVGKLTRTLSRKGSISANWSYVNSSCVILVVYSSLAVSKHAFAGLSMLQYTLIPAAVALVHILLLIINGQTGKLLGLSLADRKAMIFVVSQKTLPISLAVLANINFDTDSAIIVCLMFHFFQLFVDSFLAAWMEKKLLLSSP